MIQIKVCARFNRGIRTALIITVALILIAIAVYVYLFYQGQKSDDTIVYKSRLQAEANAFTDKLILEIENVKHTTVDSPSEGGLINGEDAIATEKTIEISDSNDLEKAMLLNQLKEGYTKVLLEQKQEALRQLTGLVETAKSDWAEQVYKQQTTTEYKERLLSEYLAKANVLETQMDANFEELLTKMTDQLQKEGFDPVPVIKGFRDEYERVKRENRNEMMGKAIEAIKQK